MNEADRLFEFIVQHKQEHDGNSPSIREMADGIKSLSTSYVHYLLVKLSREGRIRLGQPHTSRQVEVVGGAWSINS